MRSIDPSWVLVLDAGTTTFKAFLFDCFSEAIIDEVKTTLSKDVRRQGTFVEQSPQELLEISKSSIAQLMRRNVMQKTRIAAMGIANQRESLVVWDKQGEARTPMIVWEDQRSQPIIERLRSAGDEPMVRQRTGLTLDPYFTASKITWLIEHNVVSREEPLYWGTLDSWLLYHLTENHVHRTDATNASRTLLYNIRTRAWDESLRAIFNVPSNFLFPSVQEPASSFGRLRSDLGQELPILAICGDQQASHFAAGKWKMTFGTGGFIMENIGSSFQLIDGLFTTLTPSATRAETDYALEGKVNAVAARVTPLIGKEPELVQMIETVAREMNELLRSFPDHPDRIIADGGVINDPRMVELQSRISDCPVIAQNINDGTALGVLRLVRRTLLSK